ncbi:MAG: DUF4132 domain-containing protein [Dorea sp.]|nr:DUF4132 domain-containing protein [Dorea sp.]
MADFTYQTRKKLSETWVNEFQEKGKHLSKKEKEMLPEVYSYAVPRDACDFIRRLLTDGSYHTLSKLYKSKFKNLVEVCVPGEKREEFYFALDQMNQYQMTAGWYRRSLRSGSYAPFAEQSVKLLRAYARLKFYNAELADVLTGNTTPEIYDHARNEQFAYAEMLAAQIDMGGQKTVQAVKDILLGEGNTLMLSHELIRGIVMCRNEELYDILGRFLLAARLQEGARQAVCENMDAGRPEAFLHLFTVIEENNLIRYSSVKRAAATWIGIFDDKSIDRLTEKLFALMGRCLRDSDFCDGQLKTEDSVAISCALWAKGFYDAGDAVRAVQNLIVHGTKHQKMTASFFNRSIQDGKLRMQASKDVILRCLGDLELVACFLPGFMESVNSDFYRLVKAEDSSVYSFRGSEVVKPKKMRPEEMFADRKEAEACYQALKEVLGRIPKKGLKLSPCIFPWYQVVMSQSDVAARMCLIAWMLQEDKVLDEAAELIPLIGQGCGYSYYSASRAAAARLLLYRPESEVRKKVLFELLHNPEEYTNEEAYRLADDMKLAAGDYVKIERNLKYKKGRKGVLALLKKQDKKNLAACITRLLAEKSEECHMGALDLSLQLKKEDAGCFEEIVPCLRQLSNPTGKEQVLLQELLGEESAAQDILDTPGYGLYRVDKTWVLPPVEVDGNEVSGLFTNGEEACIRVCKRLDKLIEENRTLSYKTAWDTDELLGNDLKTCRYIHGDKDAEPLDAYPFREMWEEFYKNEIRTPELLLELELYRQCCGQRNFYEYNSRLYKKVFGSGVLKKPPFQNLLTGISYGKQVWTVISVLFSQYVPDALKARFALRGMTKYLSVLNTTNDIFSVSEKRWNGAEEIYTKRTAELPIFADMLRWLSYVGEDDWGSAFTLRFQLGQHYLEQESREKGRQYSYQNRRRSYLEISEYVKCYVRGVWDKDLFYKAIFTFSDLGSLLEPVSTVEQKGAVSARKARVYGLNCFFGYNVVVPVDGKYRFEELEDKMPEMAFAHELYRELIPIVMSVELKRGEQPTPFSEYSHKIHAIYGIDYMIQILTALGKDPLQRSYSYYSPNVERKSVLSHLLKVCMPKPEETAADLKAVLKGTDITRKRLVELAMYAQQWIPMIEEYLKIPGFASTCYYFMAHTSEQFDEQVTSVIAKYTPLSIEELKDGAFDIHWFFEAYKNVGEKNFKLLYDAAKYSSTGTAHGRARKYADAALGKVQKTDLQSEIEAKRNKDLLMSIGLLPLPERKGEREEELLERYQFIQKYKKKSRQFGAQRRASEGRAVEIALQNLSVNAGFTDVTRLVLRMEGKLVEQSADFFDWKPVEELELMISVDENGKSTLKCRKDGKLLKSVPAKLKKNEAVKKYQEVNKKLKEQYSRTKQMMEQAMEDRTAFEVWELLELQKNPVARPIVEFLVVRTFDGEGQRETNCEDAVCKVEGSQTKGSQTEKWKAEGNAGGDGMNWRMGFLTAAGLVDEKGDVTPVKPEDKLLIAHPCDLYVSGRWHEYQKYLFEKQVKQPFKQVFRELYLKLDEELEKGESRLFSGNQIQPQKTVGALKSRRWVADYEDGLQKIYYKENIVACIYAMADWFTPSDVEAPTLEWVVFSDRKTGKQVKLKDIPDVVYSEVMRDVDLAVSVAHAGGVDPETSHSTIEMRRAIAECSLELFRIENVRLEGSHALIDGKLGQYSVHLGSGVVHQIGNAMLSVVPVHSQHRGRIFLPFIDDDPKTAEILSKILLFAEDAKIKDPAILSQIR